MKAAYIKQTGTPAEIIYGDLPLPVITENDVLVAVETCSVNFVDTFVRAGSYQTKLPLPFLLGRDAVGIVQAVGAKVTAFKVGQRVWTNSMGHDGRQGVSAAFISVPQERLFLAPENVDPLILVASVHSAATAAIILTDVMQASADQTILIEGAAGHVGTKVVELANQFGLTVWTTSHPRDFERLSVLGADQTYDYHDELLFKRLKKEKTAGIEHVIDTSGKVSLQANLELLAVNGEVTLITAPADNHFTFLAREFYTASKQINGFVISHASLEQIQKAGQLLNDSFAKGKLLETQIRVEPLEQARWAHENIGKVKERIVLDLR